MKNLLKNEVSLVNRRDILIFHENGRLMSHNWFNSEEDLRMIISSVPESRIYFSNVLNVDIKLLI